MSPPTAIRIDDDLAPGEATVAVWTTHHKSPRLIDVIDNVTRIEISGQKRVDDLVDNEIMNFFIGNMRRMLGGKGWLWVCWKPLWTALRLKLTLTIARCGLGLALARIILKWATMSEMLFAIQIRYLLMLF